MDTSLLIALVGVGGTVLGSVIGLTGSIVLEKIRLKNERKSYVIKSMFDKEFAIYQDLNGKFGTLISSYREFCVIWEFGITKDKEMINKQEKFYKNINAFLDAYADAELELSKCSPFIQSNIENKYQNIIDICRYIPRNCDILQRCYDNPNAIFDNEKNNKEKLLKELESQYKKAKISLTDAFKEIKIYKNSLEEK